MITGEIRSKIDQIWDAFWTGGVASPIAVIEQMTYLLFIKGLDEVQAKKEKQAQLLGGKVEDTLFPEGDFANPVTKEKVAYRDLRWSRFKNLEPRAMHHRIANEVFPFIKSLGAEDSAFAVHMKDAYFMIPPEKAGLLARVVDMLDEIPMEDRDTKGDLYEYMLGKLSQAGDSGQFRTPRHIIFNKDTVDKVLEHLMRNGLRVDGCQKIGKTIIFAKNHHHAMFIQERFDENYPHLKGKFARVIDNQETYAQDLIDKFSIQKHPPADAPQIAISVDMLDTGIDVPDVVNLVFFKIVRSKTKFWQMIGRGTRLCPDLFGEGRDKEHFFVFDFCGNFEFFNEHPEGVEGTTQEPVGTRIFRARLSLLQALEESSKDEAGGDTLRVADGEKPSRLAELSSGIRSTLHGEVLSMNLDNFIVRPKRRVVEPFQGRGRWDDISSQDYADLYNEIAPLPTQMEPEHPTAKFFDLLILRIQIGNLRTDPAVASLIENVREIAAKLEEVQRIPEVKAQIALIHELQGNEYWETADLPMLETVRQKLRHLVKHIEHGSRKIVTTDFEDEIGEGVEVILPNLGAAIDRGQYKRKFEDFLKQHENDLALKKVKYNEPLTKLDIKELERMFFESGEIGSREEFESCFGTQEGLGVFIRKLVGLDREAAKKAFDRYLDTTTFDSKQIQFVNQVIDYLTQNGVMDPKMLFEHPFTNLSPGGPTSLFKDDDATKIVGIIRAINTNASVG